VVLARLVKVEQVPNSASRESAAGNPLPAVLRSRMGLTAARR